jgi:hypothetical protein
VSKESVAPETASVTLPGTVDKVIKSPDPSEPDKAQIVVEGADDLYREIRIDNALQTEKGEEVALKPGTDVDVTVEAPADATTPKVAWEGKYYLRWLGGLKTGTLTAVVSLERAVKSTSRMFPIRQCFLGPSESPSALATASKRRHRVDVGHVFEQPCHHP